MSEDIAYLEYIQQAESELYSALEALESENLTFARSSAARAQYAVIEAYRVKNASSGNTRKAVS